MNKNSKIFLIANTPNFFSNFMLNHIKKLNKKYKLFIFCNDAHNLKKSIPGEVSLNNINFKRGLNVLYDVKAFFVTLFFFIKIKPNISISFTPKIGLIVAVASFIARTPKRIHWFTGQIWETKTGFLKHFYKFIDKIIFYLSHKLLVDSISQRKFLIKEKVVSLNKSTVIHKGSVGGVDTKKFIFNKKKRNQMRNNYLIPNDTFIFLYLGRINKEKGIIELIKAFKKIEKNKKVLLIFVGAIEDKEIIYHFKNNKKILNFKYTKNPQDWFSMADILCLPSYREGFGTVVIEAGSSGIPSLCSKIYGLYDAIIENKTGFFHKSRSIDDIKNKMLYVIKNKKLTKEYGKMARKRVIQDFEQSLVSKKFLKFINLHINR